MSTGLGFSGVVARTFQNNQITPLLALVGLLLGLLAVVVTPREEEPQIDVTFANVFIPFPGATAAEIEHLVSTPAEQVLSEIDGIKHVFSVSRPGMAVLTVQFEVGEDRTQAIVRLYNKVFSNQDWLPQGLGVGQPIIKPKGIDDVPIVSFTLWTTDPQRAGQDLLRVAHSIEVELKRIPGTRDVYSIGGPDQVVHVLLDPQRMAGYDIAIDDLRRSLTASNVSRDAGAWVADNRSIAVQVGELLTSAEAVAELVVGIHGGAPIYLADVARIELQADHPETSAWFGYGRGADIQARRAAGLGAGQLAPAVTIAVAKKPGSNAVAIADALARKIEQLHGTHIPDGVEVSMTRNYGATADNKARTLIGKLIFATLIVIALVMLALGRREAVVVGAAVVITLALTLFASWTWGFTLNRVSLFALIFSIGILVDDAIVVVENIHRHMALGEKNLLQAIPVAVDEVGGPTILATFAVIAALLPMAFVSGLMGPYMSPIPINASLGMLISLIVAFVVTPWLSYKLLKVAPHGAGGSATGVDLGRVFRVLLSPFLRAADGRTARRILGLAMLLLILFALSLVGLQVVVLKMLPYDNKSEFQIVLDMPEGSTLEQTTRVLDELGLVVADLDEVLDYQIYAGTAAPINFNGLVRQYYLRNGAHLGDIQVNLVDKDLRERKSHTIAAAARPALEAIGARFGASVKVVEVPPGPPVMAPLVAEVYGPDYAGQMRIARKLRESFATTAHVVDVDDSIEAEAERLVLRVDRSKAALLGVTQADIADAVATVLNGSDIGYLHGANVKHAVPIRVEFPLAEKATLESILALNLRSRSGGLVPMGEVLSVHRGALEKTIYHKDLLPVVFVTADLAGGSDSPLYGLLDLYARVGAEAGELGVAGQHLVSGPEHPFDYSIKWDGEWQITYETFRDMGIAYAVGMVLIYLLVVMQFRSYLVPLIIMAPIPLTVIGVMPGHALLGVQFTATSMIGMIALAGIIVRNSILLVDFINQQVAAGMDFADAVIKAGEVRTKPIVLTALAAMLGAFFILDDPIFSGLAVSLIFGILVSTLLTLVVIPVLYYAAMYRRLERSTPASGG